MSAATIVLLVAQAGVFLLSLAVDLALAMGTDSCTSSCDNGTINVGLQLPLVGGMVALVVSIGLSVLLMARRRRSFWIPIVGILIQVALLVIGAGLMESGMHLTGRS
ncbi:hypothetical protein [Jongsikchunia kroppenstedtii]|uniref:hypothetical protein n=1 Tax=Jongsikchunia kroppenstedtii TaxID=1121721 RepID=UPI00037B2095|nr:hypothetical protein [Jongsikchunia kroppenstedtii]